MSVLCFATFADTLRHSMSKNSSNLQITSLLLDFVIDVAGIKDRNKNELEVDSNMAYELMHRKAELRSSLRTAAGNPDVMDQSIEFFETVVLPEIDDNLVLDLIDKLRKLIQDDETIGDTKKQELLEVANENKRGLFLADVFLYVLSKKNNRQTAGETSIASPMVKTNTLLPEEALNKIVSGLVNAVVSYDPNELLSVRAFQNQQIAESIQPMLQSGRMSFVDFNRCKNFMEIAQLADEQFKQEAEAPCETDEFDFDWFMRFFEAAGNISNKEMQQLWAKVLAGEIKSQGSFSLRAVETLRNMSLKEAQTFQRATSLLLREIDGELFLFCDSDLSDYELNERYNLSRQDILLLEECGLISALRMSNSLELTDEAGGFLTDDGLILLFENETDESISLGYKSYPLSYVAEQLLPIVQEKTDDEYVAELGRILRADYAGKVSVSLRRILSFDGNSDIELDLEHDLLDES